MDKPILIGTWRSAIWALRFYEKNGFSVVPDLEKNRLLKKYWDIPFRQTEASVVVADDRALKTIVRGIPELPIHNRGGLKTPRMD